MKAPVTDPTLNPFPPLIVIDTREKTPLTFTLPSAPGTLHSGDYSIAGLEHEFAIERKTIPDLIASVTRHRARFERELHRLRGFAFARLIIIGDPYELHRTTHLAKAVHASLDAFEARWRIPVVWAPTPQAAARLVERWVWFFWRERSPVGRYAGPCELPPAIVRSHDIVP